ncbi:F-box protein-like protein [Tanacetum coccineum]|uniref:F-box protein-like protein n=1 Tax=Tanacetum coccineum TaxID=301880 RepID=A0ABQ5EGM9_9ASTR
METITRVSKKLITAPGEKKLPSSSVLRVVSNDDLLIEILLRLPVSSIHMFKFVSKRWLSLLTSPSFTLRRSQIPSIDPPSGLFIQIENSFMYNFVSLDPRIPSSIYPPSFILTKPDTFYVYNLSNNRFKILPRCHYLNSNIKMAFDPTKSPHYKVVHAKDIIDDPILTTMRTPQTLDGMVFDDCKLFESCGRLLFVGAVSAHYPYFNVYEMMNGSSKWFIKYTFNRYDIVFPFPNYWTSNFWCIVLGEREEDSFIILELHGRVVEYNIQLKTIGRKLYNLGLVSPHGCFPFIASFAGV